MSDNFTETHFYHCICVSFVVHNIAGELTLLTPGNAPRVQSVQCGGGQGCTHCTGHHVYIIMLQYYL